MDTNPTAADLILDILGEHWELVYDVSEGNRMHCQCDLDRRLVVIGYGKTYYAYMMCRDEDYNTTWVEIPFQSTIFSPTFNEDLKKATEHEHT